MTFSPIAERLTGELLLHVLAVSDFVSEFEHVTFRLRGEHSYILRYRRGLKLVLSYLKFYKLFVLVDNHLFYFMYIKLVFGKNPEY